MPGRPWWPDQEQERSKATCLPFPADDLCSYIQLQGRGEAGTTCVNQLGGGCSLREAKGPRRAIPRHLQPAEDPSGLQGELAPRSSMQKLGPIKADSGKGAL